jgi:hypothetical protein
MKERIRQTERVLIGIIHISRTVRAGHDIQLDEGR